MLESQLLQRNGIFFELKPLSKEAQALCATELGILPEEKLLDKAVGRSGGVVARASARVFGAAQGQKCGKKRRKLPRAASNVENSVVDKS